MAGSKDGKGNKKKGGGGRTAAVGLIAVGAVVGAWLSNCIPGFGIGADGSADGDAQNTEQVDDPAEPAAPEAELPAQPEQPQPPEAKGPEQGAKTGEGEAAGDAKVEDPTVASKGPLMITVDVRGCSVAGGEPQDCMELCKQEELFAGVESVKLDTTEGPHKAVVSLLDCLREAEIPVAVTRDE